ncbi:MAG: hypothetical protein JWO08_1440, partial [Verrucomicrobiaceae bacterium]|nr:hypothetical protein [Verrucomicrobiaceae bacterium]
MNFPRLLLPLLLPSLLSAATIEKVWLTHATTDPSHLTANWETEMPGASVVEFGTTASYGQRVVAKESTTLHHVDIPIIEKDKV